MKVAFLTDVFPRISNTFIINQIIGLLVRDVEVDIFARHLGDTELMHGDIVSHRLLDRMRHIEIPRRRGRRALKAVGLLRHPWGWHRATLDSLNAFRHGRQAMSLGQLYTTLSFLRADPYDIIHCQFGNLGLVATPLLKQGAVSGKVITAFRGTDVTKHLPRLHRQYLELFRHGHLFLPVSDVFKRQLIAAGCDASKIEVHHSGIDCDRFVFRERRRDPDEPTNLLFVGRLEPIKGVAYAIEAAARLIASGRQVDFDIVGGGSLHAELEALVDRLGVSDRVRLLGPQPQSEVIRKLDEAHLLVAPSVTTEENDQEGIPNVLKEGMAVGLPVVGTVHSGVPELVEDGVSGYLVLERDVDGLTDRLAELIDHPERWGEMGRAGRRKVEEEFDIEPLNDELVELYRRLISS